MQTEIMKQMYMKPIQFSRNVDPTGDIKAKEDEIFERVPQPILDNIYVYRKNKIPTIAEIVSLISCIE